LYDEQVRVPMILVVPGVTPRRVSAPVETVDLAVTLLSLVDVTPSARMRGTDLGPWLAEPPAAEGFAPPAFAEIETKKMLAAGTRKVICDTAIDTCELYDLASDPAERRNLIGAQPGVAAELRGRLDAWIASHSRLEAETDFRGQAERARHALERGRLGDRSAVPELATLVASADPRVRREAARLLAELPEDARARAPLSRVLDDPEAGPWAAVALARSCDPEAKRRLAGRRSDGDPELDARAGLALAGCRENALVELEAGLKADDV